MQGEADERVYRNARLVLADEVVDGHLVLRGGSIVEIGAGATNIDGVDLEGDYLVPGLVELHTDHLEGHYAPRPRVRWDPKVALLAHDAQIAAAGITTVFDALRVGMDEDAELGIDDMMRLEAAICEGVDRNRLRAEHFIHLRCEVSAPDCLDAFRQFENHGGVGLVSLMDHAPGQRQFRHIEAYRAYYQGKLKMPDDVFDRFCARRIAQSEANSPANRSAIARHCAERGIVLASHDDATDAHVDDAVKQGVHIAEFPTTLEAARGSHEAGMAVLMGAPNLVRGGSHSGNVSARELAEANLLDILSSDYIPFSLIQAAFVLGDGLVASIDLAAAIRMVTLTPANRVGLTDRGELAIGKRGDLVRVRLDGNLPVVRTVWRQGRRVI
ncbi:alpha-D-ribose 1-methylphosphonate 5-triphosphate diphosphatase [Pararhizobium haloflavum]|uniref:alpha-D-ribose 1-methylphosphonate 5-triphosphate diphosphatase n=1 Tax=Pararhizobium haloflavum TaxID=2037914 RepID=UPI000C18AE96|nr:alpha-D-ribose 1-methylphosphonate 5-triphosphate diphosphatase [Pararhizobium haloflavum]